MDALERIQILGRGGYAHVELMRDTDGRSYALKCINKSRVVAAGQRRHVKAEREILLDIDSKFILKLYKTFRDKKYVYLLTEALLGGELFTLMKRSGPLDEQKAMFAMACVLEAIEYLHSSMVSFFFEICVQNRKFGQKSKFWSKIQMLLKNRNLCQKSKIWSKIEILVKNRNFGQKSKCCSKIENVVNNWNVCQKSKIWSKIKNLVKNRNLYQKSKIWSKI